MKRILFLFCFITTLISYSQQEYTIDGQTYILKTEVKGPINLLWNSIDNEYRYFIKKGASITELKNTKKNGVYQEEYKTTLKAQAAEATLPIDKVKLTLPSLSKYVINYNKQVDPTYTSSSETIQLKTRLGAFAGISNNVYYTNPDNTILPALGVEFEIIDDVKLKRHALVVRFKQLLESDDYDFSYSEFSLNYRFKFIKSTKIDVFVNAKVAAYSYASRDVTFINSSGNEERITGSGGDLQAPGAFGLGADFALGNGYLTFSYNDIVAIGLESSDEFPVDFTLGYKFNL